MLPGLKVIKSFLSRSQSKKHGLSFEHLNHGWDADPNAPYSAARADGAKVHLRFYLNHFLYEAHEGEWASLVFDDCSLWRLGGTNDEGWYMGQCRYSKIAPAWGAFYELMGPDPLRYERSDWQTPPKVGAGDRHFLFYMKDSTFECFAKSWSFKRGFGLFPRE